MENERMDKAIAEVKAFSEEEGEEGNVKREMEWISVDDRLPEVEDVLIVRGGCVYPRYYSIKKKKFYSSWSPYAMIFENEIYGVTHWMPLPKPPDSK